MSRSWKKSAWTFNTSASLGFSLGASLAKGVFYGAQAASSSG